MKLLGWDPMRSVKLHHVRILRWGKRIACSNSSSISYMRVHERASSECCKGGTFFSKHLVWKIRSRWKHCYLKHKLKRGNTVQFSYDAQSYSQNFDNGCPLVDRPSRFVP